MAIFSLCFLKNAETGLLDDIFLITDSVDKPVQRPRHKTFDNCTQKGFSLSLISVGKFIVNPAPLYSLE
jgi:hypothetical protein